MKMNSNRPIPRWKFNRPCWLVTNTLSFVIVVGSFQTAMTTTDYEESELLDFLNSSSDSSTAELVEEFRDLAWYDIQEYEVPFLPISPPLLYCDETLLSDEEGDETDTEDLIDPSGLPRLLPPRYPVCVRCNWRKVAHWTPPPECWSSIFGDVVERTCPRCMDDLLGPGENHPVDKRWYLVNMQWLRNELGEGPMHTKSLFRANLLASPSIPEQHEHVWRQYTAPGTRGRNTGKLLLVYFQEDGNILSCCGSANPHHFTRNGNNNYFYRVNKKNSKRKRNKTH
jgi:hypothetical protein